jgi:AraC family transcriptional regulator
VPAVASASMPPAPSSPPDLRDADAPRETWHSAGLNWGEDVRLVRVDDPSRAVYRVDPHDALTIVLVTAGTYEIESRRAHGWESAVMAPGRTAITAPGREVDVRWTPLASAPMRSLRVHLAPAILREAELDARAPDYLARDDDFLRAAVAELDRGARRGAPALFAQSLGVAIAAHLRWVDPPTATGSGGGLHPRELRTVIAFLDEHAHEDITLDDLAAVAHLSRYHFLRMFRASTGRTPLRYLTDIRMRRAADLLETADLPVHEIGRACGYPSASSFAAAFRRHYGVTPTGYRASRQ